MVRFPISVMVSLFIQNGMILYYGHISAIHSNYHLLPFPYLNFQVIFILVSLLCLNLNLNLNYPIILFSTSISFHHHQYASFSFIISQFSTHSSVISNVLPESYFLFPFLRILSLISLIISSIECYFYLLIKCRLSTIIQSIP